MGVDERLALIEKDIGYIKTFIDEDRHKMKDHIETSEEFRSKVIELSHFGEDLDNHIIADRWMFGLLITLEVAALGKLFFL